MLLLKNIIFGSKWILPLFYFGLVLAQVMYCIKFSMDIWHMLMHFMDFDENQMLMAVLKLVDLVMVANLIKTIISGSYYAFVDRSDIDEIEKISSGYLKVKMGMSLVGISSIHLLQTFINAHAISDRDVYMQMGMHALFVLSALAMALLEYMHEKSKAFGAGH